LLRLLFILSNMTAGFAEMINECERGINIYERKNVFVDAWK